MIHLISKTSVLTCLLCLSVMSLSGCGGTSAGEDEGPALIPVSGKVILEKKPLAAADLTFVPTGTTEGTGGSVRTNETGEFTEVMYARGGVGLPPGTYKVAVSKRVMPDGSPVPADDQTPPIESPARETMPPSYSDPEMTELEVVVEEGKLLELKLQKT